MNPDDTEETKMKTKMKVAVCTLLCMTMACAAANAEGGTTNSTNSGQRRRSVKTKSNQAELSLRMTPPFCVKVGSVAIRLCMVYNESINKRRRDKKQNGREQRSEAEEGVFFRKN